MEEVKDRLYNKGKFLKSMQKYALKWLFFLL